MTDFPSSPVSETPSDLKTVLGWLKDPVVVHLNMLRGTIAKPTWEQIQHLYPEQFADHAQRQQQSAGWRWRRIDESTWVYNERSPNFINPSHFVVEQLYSAVSDTSTTRAIEPEDEPGYGGRYGLQRQPVAQPQSPRKPASVQRGEPTEEELATAFQFALEKPSVSYIQRKMGIGYNHAMAIMETLEDEGVISRTSASGVRIVLSNTRPDRGGEA